VQGDSPSLLGTSDSTGSEAYPGSSQCTSRHTVTFSSTSEHGMGTTISNFQCHQASLGSSSSGTISVDCRTALDMWLGALTEILSVGYPAGE
jgi:hypothetical protein